MSKAQILARTMCRLAELGLSLEQIKVCVPSIVPAVIAVGENYEKNINLSCEMFAEQIR